MNTTITIWKLFGIMGVILISFGILARTRGNRDFLSFIGGTALLIYSISVKDFVFIILQIIYITVIAVDYFRKH